MLQSQKMKCLVLSRYPHSDPLRILRSPMFFCRFSFTGTSWGRLLFSGCLGFLPFALSWIDLGLLVAGVSLSFLISNSGLIFLRVYFHSFLLAGFILTVNKRFSDIVLMCWTQLLNVACRILKLLLELPYSCSLQKYTATRSTVLLGTVNSKPFHVNIKE